MWEGGTLEMGMSGPMILSRSESEPYFAAPVGCNTNIIENITKKTAYTTAQQECPQLYSVQTQEFTGGKKWVFAIFSKTIGFLGKSHLIRCKYPNL